MSQEKKERLKEFMEAILGDQLRKHEKDLVDALINTDFAQMEERVVVHMAQNQMRRRSTSKVPQIFLAMDPGSKDHTAIAAALGRDGTVFIIDELVGDAEMPMFRRRLMEFEEVYDQKTRDIPILPDEIKQLNGYKWADTVTGRAYLDEPWPFFNRYSAVTEQERPAGKHKASEKTVKTKKPLPFYQGKRRY